MNPLRTGKNQKVRPELRKWTIEKRREQHPLWEEVEIARETLEAKRVEMNLVRESLEDLNLGIRKREELEEEESEFYSS